MIVVCSQNEAIWRADSWQPTLINEARRTKLVSDHRSLSTLVWYGLFLVHNKTHSIGV